jgi:hypothetical protein
VHGDNLGVLNAIERARHGEGDTGKLRRERLFEIRARGSADKGEAEMRRHGDVPLLNGFSRQPGKACFAAAKLRVLYTD